MQTDYPSLIKSLKEEITTIKTQIGLELNSSASSATSRREVNQNPKEVLRLKSEIESQRELVETMRRKALQYRDLGLGEGWKMSPSESLTLLVTRLQAKIADYSRKVTLLKGGEQSYTPRMEFSKNTANEQFTNLQKRIGALERRNEAIRERMKTVENERLRLEDSYQSAVTRAKGEQSLQEQIDNLERDIGEKERKITLLRLYKTKNSQLDRNRYQSPSKSAASQKQLFQLRENVKYLQSKIADLEKGTRKPIGLQAFVDRLKSEGKKTDEEIQLTSKRIREKDRELLNLELIVEQLKSDLEKAKGSYVSLRIRESSPTHTNSPSPINRSLALLKPSVSTIDAETEPQPYPQRSPDKAVKRCESLSALRKRYQSPAKSVGLASRIVAMNRGQFETNKQQCRR
jgi:chromosome segregation ATPase